MDSKTKKAKKAEYDRAWRKRNLGYVRRKNLEWQKRNPEKRRAICKRHYKKSPDRIRKWAKENPEKVARNKKKSQLKKYGLTIDVYDRLVVKGCVLCGKKNALLCMDHDHSTGKFRGILCSGCNIMIGCIEKAERLDLWDRIEEYLDDA